MKKFLFSGFLTLIVLASQASDKGTWTGYITDEQCGVKSAKEGHEECAKKCIASGKTTVLVVGDKMYKISDPKKVEAFIGQKVSIKGKMNGDVVYVKKVTKA
ncbi:MAG: hypothetical protein FJX89_07075 [Bacteroidetes bacterium]|nr:hypothetical protein [Bacteroidota bacterium]